MLPNEQNAVTQREPLIRIGCDGRVQGGVTDCNAGSRRNDPPNVLVMAAALTEARHMGGPSNLSWRTTAPRKRGHHKRNARTAAPQIVAIRSAKNTVALRLNSAPPKFPLCLEAVIADHPTWPLYTITAHSDDRDHSFRRIATSCSDRSRPMRRGC